MDKLYSWSKNGMKMIINTDFKKFNKQTNCISKGSALSNTQYSNYIRPYNKRINPAGELVERGYLQNYDLQYFNLDGYNNLKDFIKKQDHAVILYEFFVWNKDKKDVIGWLVQDSLTEEFILEQVCHTKWRVDYGKRHRCLLYLKELLQE